MTTFAETLSQVYAAGDELRAIDITQLLANTNAAYYGRGKQVDITTTGTVNNHAPAEGMIVRCNNATALIITGIVANQDGEIRIYENVGTSTLKFSSEDAGSTAANRITLSTAYQWIGPGGHVAFRYDGTSDRWRMLYVEPGSWITPTFAAGDFTAGGTQTWTLASGDVEVYKYRQQGKSLAVKFRLNTTSVGGTPDPALYILVPGGLTIATSANGAYWLNDNAGGWKCGIYQTATGVPTKIGLYRETGFPSTNWTASANLTDVYGEIPGIDVA